MAREERAGELDERVVLRLGEGNVVGAFELDADGEIVAALAPVPRRGACMPRAIVGRNVLAQLPVAANEEMRGDLESVDLPEVFVLPRIEAVLEERVDPGAPELARRQRDRMDHDELDARALGACIEVRGRHPEGGVADSVADDHFQTGVRP